MPVIQLSFPELDIAVLTFDAPDKGANILNIAAYAFAIENNLSWYGDTLNHLAQLIETHKIDAPAVNVIGNLNVETVQEAHRLMEANCIYGKKLVMST